VCVCVCVCVTVSASRSRSRTFQRTSHVNYSVIKTYKLAEQTRSYMHNHKREDYGSNLLHSRIQKTNKLRY